MINKMEKGQSMVLITGLLFAFFAILALVLDGGFLYYMRRNAQNAADAGALAGADDLCKFKDTGKAVGVAESTALDNGVYTALANATLANPGGYVEVNTTIEYQSFFARLLNLNTAYPPAYAKAGCAPPGAGVGVLPVAWSCRPPNAGEQSDSDDCTLHYMNGDECSLDDDPMYIVVDSDTIEEDIYCQDPPNSGQPDPEYLDCDFDNDGVNDITPLSGGNRSWLNLDGSQNLPCGGGGADELNCWIDNGFPGTIVPHTWIAGSTGAKTAVYQTVHDYLHGEFIIPVFNDLCPEGLPNEKCPGQMHDEDKIVVLNGSADYFHIISFSYFHIECVNASPFPLASEPSCDVHDYLENQGVLKDNVKTIEGCFVEGFANSIGGDPGQGIDAGVYTIFLME